MTYTLFSKPAKLDFPARLLPCNREPERTHDVSGHYLLSSRDSGGIVQAMGGRRSRYWCGPGIFRETKKAPVRGFIGQWSAPCNSRVGQTARTVCPPIKLQTILTRKCLPGSDVHFRMRVSLSKTDARELFEIRISE